MKKFAFCIIILCLACLAGCSKNNSMLDLMNNPPESPGSIIVSGTAPYSPITYIMREGAETAARAAVARVIATRVQEVIKRWAEENHSNIANTPTFNTYFASAVQAISDQNLAGARITHWYYDKDTKTQYALAEYKLSDANRLARTQIGETQKQIEVENQTQIVFASNEEARRAFNELDLLIEQEFSSGM